MRTFNDALAKLNGRTTRRLEATATTVERIDTDEIGVRYHNTFVVRYFRNGSVTIHTGGWYTATTKRRINAYSPARISSWVGGWVSGGWLNKNLPFVDGMDVGTPQALFGFGSVGPLL